MPKIVYRGHTPVVYVPTPYNLANVQQGVPIDVPAQVAEDLTAGGTSAIWFRADDETPED